MNNFGFTNDDREYNRVVKFREDATKDGWSIEPTFGDESVDSHATLEKDGFKIHVKARKANKWKYEAQITIWGPDRLQIKPPKEYSWQAISDGVRTCNSCKATNVVTHRYSFAGRCCENCIPEMKAKHERPGWTR